MCSNRQANGRGRGGNRKYIYQKWPPLLVEGFGSKIGLQRRIVPAAWLKRIFRPRSLASQNCSRVLPMECARNALSNFERNCRRIFLLDGCCLTRDPIHHLTRCNAPPAPMSLKDERRKLETRSLANLSRVLVRAFHLFVSMENKSRLIGRSTEKLRLQSGTNCENVAALLDVKN